MNIRVIILALLLAVGGFYLLKSGVSGRSVEIKKEEEAIAKAQTPSKYNTRSSDPEVRVTTTEKATIQIFEECAPSVVFIKTSQAKRDYWTRNIMEIPAGTGSGFVWDEQGHIVTNFHVIQGASSVSVTLADHSTHNATVIGYEKDKDLAVLKIDKPSDALTPIKIGLSSQLKVGQNVYAIGNPFGLDQTLTTGIISALGREIKAQSGVPIKDVIQTDAAINPGNSGGPLLDSSGRLIGVNTMIYSPSGASAGIGFSIPVDEVNYTVTDLLNDTKRPVMGITILPEQYLEGMDVDGAVILEVNPSTPAQLAGLRGTRRGGNGQIIWGDIIKRVDTHKVTSNKSLLEAMKHFSPGNKVVVTLERNGRLEKVQLTLAAAPK